MPMPNVSNRNCLTLNHLFTVPSSHKRNFVRENKQLVREKSKQQHAKYDIAKASNGTNNRAAFGSSSGRGSLRTDQVTNGLHPDGTNSTKSQWQHRNLDLRAPLEQRETLSPKTSKFTYNQRRHPIIRTKSKNVAIETHNAATQTDEICDEVYLYTALKKCASPAFKSALKAKYLQKDEEARQKNQQQLPLACDNTQFPPDEGTNRRSEVNAHHYQHKETQSSNKQNNLYEKEERYPPFKSLQNNLRPNSQQSRHHEDNIIVHQTSDVNDLFNVMSLPPELNKKCQPSECNNCPEGYHLLTERERDFLKKKLLEKETLLIKQLNSFPLAIETLRVRQTKTRIERDLSVLEQNLRKLTKKKVYAKLNE